MLKSVWAVFAGVLFTVVVTVAVDQVLHATHVFPQETVPLTNGLSLLATAYRFVISVGGAWLTAKLAPQNPLKHAIILGVVGTVLGLVGVIVTWNAGMGPRWYPIALTVLAIPQCWLGGKLYVTGKAKA